MQHKNTCGDGDHHIDAAVGSIVLSKALKVLEGKKSISLSTYASRETSDERYFMNKLGGLGQYYLGVLRSLRLMDGNASEGVKAIKDIGGVLAKKFANDLPAEKFMQVIKEDKVTLSDLEALHPFCLCQLNENPLEQQAMVDLFAGKDIFSGRDVNTDNDAARRRQSLLYMLQLVEATYEYELDFDVDTFRGLTYSRAFDSSDVLTIHKNIQIVADGWAAYQRNELLSIALQGLFYACLRSYELSGLTFQSVDEMSQWFWKKGAGFKVLKAFKKANNFKQLNQQLMVTMPPFEDWQDELHEIDCMNELHRLSREKIIDNKVLETMVLCSLRILSALAMRKENQTGYGDLYFPNGYFDYYPVNLNSFQQQLSDDTSAWSKLPVNKCLEKILSEWCLNSHLRVALRKLRLQSQSTFRFMPTDIGLSIIDIPKVAHTQPRFRQAKTILTDIGLLYWDNDGYINAKDNAAELLTTENETS